MQEISENVAYVTGFIVGDGNLSQGYIVRAVEENKDYIKLFAETFSNAVGTKPKIYFDKYNNSFVAYVHSKRIWKYFVNNIKIPSGTKSSTVRIPKLIMESDEKIKTAFLSGLFDAEASVIKMVDSHHPHGYLKIQFKVHNNNLAKDVFSLLINLGFKPRIYNYAEFSIVNLHGRAQGKLFLEKIGFRHPVKKTKLMAFPLTK
jgi:intein/homing endonuclease